MITEIKFSKFLKYIKDKKGFSNALLAKYMNCSEGNVSLYLSGRSTPTYERIVSLKDNLLNIEHKDLYDYIFSYFPSGYYHGSRRGIEGNINPKRNINKTLDFGYGFYLGTSFKQSSTFIASEEEGKDKIYSYSFTLDNLDVLELRDIRWVFYVAYNRGKIPIIPKTEKLLKEIKTVVEHPYDLVIGPIADDKMAISMDNFFSNLITYDQLIRCLTQLDIGDQYCLKTQKAVDNLTNEKIYQIKENGLRKFIRDYGFESTQQAMRHAEEINKENLKGKRFFDLIKEYGKKPIF